MANSNFMRFPTRKTILILCWPDSICLIFDFIPKQNKITSHLLSKPGKDASSSLPLSLGSSSASSNSPREINENEINYDVFKNHDVFGESDDLFEQNDLYLTELPDSDSETDQEFTSELVENKSAQNKFTHNQATQNKSTKTQSTQIESTQNESPTSSKILPSKLTISTQTTTTQIPNISNNVQNINSNDFNSNNSSEKNRTISAEQGAKTASFWSNQGRLGPWPGWPGGQAGRPS